MHPSGISSTARSNSQGEHIPFNKTVNIDDDKQSTINQDIHCAEYTLEALQTVAGNRVRHARCAPEFLEEVAGAHFKKFTSKKFKIITASEARSFFKNYIIEHNQHALRADSDDLTNNEYMPSPIVFAITVWEAGKKCVDYYMTWRGKTKPRHCKDFENRIARLDSDFRRLAKSLDKEFKRISSLKTNVLTSRKVEKRARFSHLRHKSRPPPNILLSNPEQETFKTDDPTQPRLPEPPVSATDSVTSLPLLNMVRGVPFSHRVPLRVTNPDRMSIISEIDVLVMGATNTPQPSSAIGETDKIIKYENRIQFSSIFFPAAPHVRDSSNTLSVPVAQRSSHKIAVEEIKNSSASIRSSDTRSSKSSVSTRSSLHSEDRHTSWQVLPEEKDKKDEPSEFLIVFLGDRLDRDPTSWHGLQKQSSIRSLPADRHSPWISPLARPDSVQYQHQQSLVMTSTLESDSSESDDEGGWMNSPVIPMKPMMEAMGLIPNTNYFRPAPVIPSIQYHPSIGSTGSPAPHQSPYLYSSPHLDSPSYVPIPLLHTPPTASPPSRPLSRAYSATYASPYMQTHNSPF